MSGHSKWKTIKHKKGIADAKRGKIFTKIAKLITIAAKSGGGDLSANFKLRLAVEKAREANMPQENIKRAINRGMGKDSNGGLEFKELVYEGFGPENTVFIVEVTTDNSNRTNSDLRNLFSKHGGNLAGMGAVSYQFEKMGYLLISLSDMKQSESIILELMDIKNIKDVEEIDEGVEVYTLPDKLAIIESELSQKDFELKEAELIYKPKSLICFTDRILAQKVISFAEIIEDHDDVQKVYANFDIDESLLGKM